MAPERWRHHLDYLVTLLGGSIGAGSLIKFPYLCMRNGGGVFLIPFLFFTFMGAIPCVFLEMVIGQYSQSGPVNVWNICPPFKGIGLGIALVNFIYVTYYIAIFAWFMYYFYHSFFVNLPWTSCNQSWNSPGCIADIDNSVRNSTSANVTQLIPSASDEHNLTDITQTVPGMTAAEEFWRLQVLQMTDGLEDLGGIRWPLVGCMAVTCLIMFLFVFRGIKVSGKVVYVTVAVPIILVIVFIIQGCLLPGSAAGIYFYVYPQFKQLLKPRMWIEACSSALFSLNIGLGNIITMAGHNKITRNCFRDALLVSMVDILFLVLAGFAFFATIGHVAHQRGVPVETFESSGFNLAFIAYPQVLTYLPLPHVWSVLTFLTLMTLEVDTLLPATEIILTAITDTFIGASKRRWVIICLILLSNFLFALPCATQGGVYIVTLMDWYAFFPAIAVFGMLECTLVSWCYGFERLKRDISIMWGKAVPKLMMLSIKYVCPLLLLAIFCYSLYSHRPPQYGDYSYPAWATGVGWMISCISIIPLPIIFMWTVYNTSGATLKQKLRTSFQPKDQWRLQTHSDTANNDALQPMHPVQSREC
ncbi:sodium- and chloride-dependent glycine transporter 1-like [Haliotis cracherodii]|uniref:sodium- and chloride-dependent glycine transporter 1-like n=1 Tax=Haliotis cracherodii TaxID=6455 RepID=UPI0039EB1370